MCRNKVSTIVDGYCGMCIMALYFLYLTIVKSALSVFDCSRNKDGLYILDADPSIRCDEVWGADNLLTSICSNYTLSCSR